MTSNKIIKLQRNPGARPGAPQQTCRRASLFRVWSPGFSQQGLALQQAGLHFPNATSLRAPRRLKAGLHTRSPFTRQELGMLSTDLIVGMAILVVAIMPLAMSFAQEAKLMRQSYQKAVAMELIDSELEILMAGEWRNFPEGATAYQLHGASVRNLPPGRALLTINGKNVRLEWLPEKGNLATKVVREGVGK